MTLLKAAACLLFAAYAFAAEKVSIRVYGGSMRPASWRYSLNCGQAIADNPGLLDVVDFQYVAFGGTRRVNGTWACDDLTGCYGNAAEECVRNATAYDPAAYMPFVLCLEDGTPHTQPKVFHCVERLGLNRSSVESCLDGPLSETLTSQASSHLLPPGTQVPVASGPRGSFTIQSPADLVEVACKFWKGTRPPFCRIL
eukprot:Rhum_TRINITY_DN14503_c3_g2::Rhum_TRINITY_DN14503_c3_g2_i1::g.95658::m.95658/K08059/IFI30, GILT; interferon, gamma-inducible protein 30